MTEPSTLTDLCRDALYAYRSSMHKRHRLVSLTIVLIVGLGIGTATTVFSVVDALLLRALPFPASEELVTVELTTAPDHGRSLFGRSPNVALYDAWRREAADVIELAGFQGGNATLTGDWLARTVQVVGISSNAIALLGAHALHGRGFVDADDTRGAAPAVVLSYSLWIQLFGGDPTAIRRPLTLNGRDHHIIGVMPAGFHIPLSIPEAQQSDPELWLPLGAFKELMSWPTEPPMPLAIIGRARFGVSMAAVEGRLDRIAKDVMNSRAAGRPVGRDAADVTRVIGLKRAIARSVRTPLLLLAGAVALLLLLVCLNVANLLMARTVGRERELAARVAIGASPSRLVRQLITEGLLVSLLGGLLGVGLTFAAIPALLDFGASYLPDIHVIAINVRVLLFSLGAAVVTGVAVSAWPAATTVRRSPVEAMTARMPTSRPATRRWMRALVALQVALAIVVLTSMGVLGRSFLRLSQVVRGYDIENVVVAGLLLPDNDYPTAEARHTFWRRLLDELGREPAVAFPAISSGLPIVGGTVGMASDVGAPLGAKPTRLAIWSVAGDYFRSLGIPILRGSRPDFLLDRQSVAIDGAAARLLFGTEDALGRRILWRGERHEGVVTAIVGAIQDLNVNTATNSRYRAITPHIYVSAANGASSVVRVSARATGDPGRALTVVRETIARIDTDLPLGSLDTMEALARRQVARERFLVVIVALFAAMAVVLTSVGIFAVMAHSTAQRTHEIGVRLVLGARPNGIVSMILGEAFALTGVGAATGILGALSLGGILDKILFETSPHDRLTIIGVVTFTVMASLMASLLPALRAARVSATVTLLGEQ